MDFSGNTSQDDIISMGDIERIINNRGLTNVIEEFKLHKRYYDDGNVVVLSYNQIKSPKQNETVDQCRGVVLNKNRSGVWEVVCRPFDRFYSI